jgi:hemerythrin-like domain-containing protein
MDEHRAIEKVLEALTAAAQTDIDLGFYERALDFIVNFADRCHHSKEEERLFPVLEERGVPRQGGPIGCMVDEHEVGRAHVRQMRQHIEAGNRDGVRQESLEYVALLKAHIQKEDFVLFPMGQTVLTDDDQSLLRSRFDEVETAHPEFQRYYQVAEELLAEAKGQAV